MSELFAAIWFFLPAGLANAAPVAAAKVPLLKRFTTPMDFGRTYHGKPILGANKTWRGLIVGVAVATIVIGLQKYLFSHNLWAFEHSWFDYRPASVWLLGPLLGGGALLADALESFFKRQSGIAPGTSWFPLDQLDYIIGGCLLSTLVVQLTLSQYIWVFGAWFGIHVVTVYLFYLVGVRDKPI